MAIPPDAPPIKPSALQGLHVLDCATFIAAPYCATLLGEFGAEVVKIELPGVGDPLRKFGTPTEAGDSLLWMSEGRNKKSVTIDLRRPRGTALFKRLVANADVLCENFQPGTLERWGLGWEVLSAINPRLILMRISAYGQTGPYRDRPGFGRIANAFGGISFLAGFPDRPPVTPGSATLADYLSGLYGAVGVLLALQARDRTGRGQVIDIGLYEPIFRILDELLPVYDRTGFVRQRMGPGTVNAVPHSHFPTKDGRWVAIACTNDKIFARLAEVIGCPEVAGQGKFGTTKQRQAARHEVDALVTHWTTALPRDEVIRRCDAGQVPCGPVYAIDEIVTDPHYLARGNITRTIDPRVGPLAVPNVVPRLSDTPGAVRWLGPALAAHADEILGGLLGLTPDEIASLRADTVI
ncbi:MAG: CoA transferase [Alphaproteobacteria bacterium]|nr:CoA transferase [Alphaproteobacteria bacterium]